MSDKIIRIVPNGDLSQLDSIIAEQDEYYGRNKVPCPHCNVLVTAGDEICWGCAELIERAEG